MKYSMEYIDIYNEKKQKTGAVKPRRAGLDKGEFALVVHICVINSEGKMLIQQRSPDKKIYAGVWDLSAGGFVMSGETAGQAAKRELEEELGVSDCGAMQYLFTEPFRQIFDDMFLVRLDRSAEDFRLQKEEVSCVRWASLDEILQDIRTGSFVDYSEECIRRIFAAAHESDSRQTMPQKKV